MFKVTKFKKIKNFYCMYCGMAICSQKSVLLHHVGSREQTQVVRLDGKGVPLPAELSHLPIKNCFPCCSFLSKFDKGDT